MSDERLARILERPVEPSGEGSVEVIGTAHVSPESVAEVESRIAERDHDVVAVELDRGRYRQFKGETPDDLDPDDLLGGRTLYQFIAYWILSYVQARMGEKFDIEPGADMLAAVEAAEQEDSGLALVDRDIQTTIQRFWTRLTFREKARLLGEGLAEMGAPVTTAYTAVGTVAFILAVLVTIAIGPVVVEPGVVPGALVGIVDLAVIWGALTIAGGTPLALWLNWIYDPEAVEEFDIEDITDTDVLTAMLEEFRRFSPGGAEALIDERDAYLAHNLIALREAGYNVIAVVGAGHQAGIEEYLADPETLPTMDSLTGEIDRSGLPWLKIVGYVFTVGYLALFGLLILGGASQQFLLGLFAVWFLVNGIAAAGMAKLAGARWTSALVGGAVAWMTSLNPALAPGWFAGYVELRSRPVNVSDIGTLNEILADEEATLMELLARLRAVPLARLILVVAMTNVGSMIASGLFLLMLPRLSEEIGSGEEFLGLLRQGIVNGWGIVTDVLAQVVGLF
ncbi:TraB/GumN family protein [Halococcoides cellulosivorans]|uniref:Conjugal transfer protein TraB n=1 Tax=Halococcoides cellulosivorans TaxID=1679096 RepID=A0A2R4WY63_9EURY|nr:TraB/GumN family protein [Halococcoides cellulosivorans]AWB26472.1 conjugal transfer protein TraB [Halococcoides cellulosivorans]